MSSTAPVPPLSIRQNMLWNSAGSLFYLVCQWLITVLVVRLSSNFDASGLLSLAMSVVGTYGTLADCKVRTYQVSDINNEHRLAEFLAFRCITLGVAFVVCMIYAAITCPPHALIAITLFYAYRGIGMLIDILHGCNQKNQRMDYIGKSCILLGVLSIIGFSVVFKLTQSLELALLAMIAAAIATFVLFDMPHTSRFEPIRISITPKMALTLASRTIPAALATLASTSVLTIPKQYLFAVSGDAALGIYSSIAAPALIVQMGAQYLYGPLLSVFPRHYSEGNVRQFNHLLVRTTLSIVLVAGICALGLVFVGEPLLIFVFGEKIREHVYLLQPVILATLATAFLWFLGDLLITVRDLAGNFIGSIAALITALPLSFLCVNAFGMNGVSFSVALSCLMGVVIFAIFLFKDLHKRQSTVSVPVDEEHGTVDTQQKASHKNFAREDAFDYDEQEG